MEFYELMTNSLKKTTREFVKERGRKREGRGRWWWGWGWWGSQIELKRNDSFPFVRHGNECSSCSLSLSLHFSFRCYTNKFQITHRFPPHITSSLRILITTARMMINASWSASLYLSPHPHFILIHSLFPSHPARFELLRIFESLLGKGEREGEREKTLLYAGTVGPGAYFLSVFLFWCYSNEYRKLKLEHMVAKRAASSRICWKEKERKETRMRMMMRMMEIFSNC